MIRWRALLPVLTLAALGTAGPTAADMLLPPGFSAQVYVTGQGFDPGRRADVRGIPAVSTLAVDHAGVLYLARTGRRYTGGEIHDLVPIYRIPPGGARLAADSIGRFQHGPPLPNPQVAVIRGGQELFVTTFDRDRKIGVLYRMADDEIELVAGGTPTDGTAPLLRQPEGAAIDAAGNLYVVDREQGAVVRLDATGRVLDLRWLDVTRPRLIAVDGDHLWIGSDGAAQAPWQRGPGEIWRVGPGGAVSVLLRGPVAAGFALGPAGHLFVADRQAAEVFVLAPDGRRLEFARFTDGDAPRGLAFVPDTPATRQAGIAGDLLVVTIPRGAWPVNDVLRVSGPFERFLRD